MNEQNEENSRNQSNPLGDLETRNAEEIKGGPKKIFIGGLSIAEEQTAPMPQTREHILLARQAG